MAEQQDPSELEEAANSGDVEKEVKLLDVSSTDLSENQDNRCVRLNVKDKDDKTAFHQAVERDDVRAIRTLFHAGADFNLQGTSYGMSPLMYALYLNKISSVFELLKLGANRNCVDNKGRSPLMLAAWHGHACLQYLIKVGAGVNFQTKQIYSTNMYLGQTALMYAAEYKRANCLQLLLEAGADINAKTSDGLTALHLAARLSIEYESVSKCMRILLNYAADCNAQMSDGQTPLMVLVSSYNSIYTLSKDLQPPYDCVKMLIYSGTDVNKADINGQTVLMHTVRNDNLVNFLPILVEAGAVVDQQDSTGMTSLAHAAITGSDKCVRVLLDAGASVNMSDHSGKSPLAHACCAARFSTSSTCALLLLDSGADVTKVDNEGQTVLMYVAEHTRPVDLLPKLLQAGVVIDQQDSNGMTALAHAVSKGGYEGVRMLHSAGASVNICDRSGKGPLHLLMSSKHGLDNSTEYYLRILLSKNPDVNAKDQNGMTPLMYAARQLVDRKPVILIDRFGRDVLDMLLDHGADVNLVDNLGQTALFYCLHGFFNADRYIELQEENPEIPSQCTYYHPARDIQLLLDKGANIGKKKISVGKLCKLTDTACDLDLLSFEVGDKVDLNVPWGKFVSVIKKGHRRILQFLIINKVMPSLLHKYRFHRTSDYITSLLESAYKFDNSGITKYLIATCYLRNNDLIFSCASQSYMVKSNNLESVTVVDNLCRQPWPLVKLCFVVVSTAFGASPSRQERVKNSQLPPKLQKMLLFQEPWSRLCVHQWDKIPLTFSWEEYDKLPQPRPLLYHWPVGRSLVPCDCGKCDGTMYKYEHEEEESDDNED